MQELKWRTHESVIGGAVLGGQYFLDKGMSFGGADSFSSRASALTRGIAGFRRFPFCPCDSHNLEIAQCQQNLALHHETAIGKFRSDFRTARFHAHAVARVGFWSRMADCKERRPSRWYASAAMA